MLGVGATPSLGATLSLGGGWLPSLGISLSIDVDSDGATLADASSLADADGVSLEGAEGASRGKGPTDRLTDRRPSD